MKLPNKRNLFLYGSFALFTALTGLLFFGVFVADTLPLSAEARAVIAFVLCVSFICSIACAVRILEKDDPKKLPPAAPSDPDARCVWMVRSFVQSYPHYSFRITGDVCMVISENRGITYVDVPCQITGIPYDIKNMNFATAELTRCTFCLTYEEATHAYNWKEKGKVAFDATGVCAQNPGAWGNVRGLEYHIYNGASVVSAVGLGVGYGEASWGA